MWLRSPLDDILSSKTKVSVLRALTLSPTPLTGRDLARATGLGQSNVSVALKQLVASGIVQARVVQPAVEFSLRVDGEPLLDALRGLFEAEDWAFASAVKELSTRIPDLASLILFGSAARGVQRSDSDTDLLVVVERYTAEVEEQITSVCQEISERKLIGLSWIVRDRAQVREWVQKGDPLWQNIRDDGVVLFGESIRELAR